MLEVEGSPEKVIERLKRTGIPARLTLSDRKKLAEMINIADESVNDSTENETE